MYDSEKSFKLAFSNDATRRLEAQKAAEDMMEYIWASPTPYHCVQQTSERLEAKGFKEVSGTGTLGTCNGAHGQTLSDRGYIAKGGSILMWNRAGSGPVRIVTAHSDSPNLRIKPKADIDKANMKVVGVETYGGLLKNSWLDRDLGVAGHLIVESANSEIEEIPVRIDEPLLRVAQLAIHLDGDIRTKGLDLNAQTHLRPIWASADYETDFISHIADAVNVDPSKVLAHRLMTFDLTKPSLWGAQKQFLSSARIDNQLSCWAATNALIEAEPSGCAIVAIFDHEEVGSVSSTGADSAMIIDLMNRLALDTSGAVIISADCAHATHPNYSDRHDSNHNVDLNVGPVIKINANERYATTAYGSAVFAQACKRAGIDHQVFVNRTDLRCGSTVGPTTAARTGIETIDVGAAQLSMHSANETTGTYDPYLLEQALRAVFNS